MDKTQKNALYKSIAEVHQNPDRFQFLEMEEGFYWVVVKDTRFRFSIMADPVHEDRYTVKYSKLYGMSSLIDCFFDDVIEYYKVWLIEEASRFLVEQDAPDLWEQAKSLGGFFHNNQSPKDDLLPFAPHEKREIKEALTIFESKVLEYFETTVEQQAYVGERLSYLAAGVDRLNRFDWKGQALQTLISIAINLSVDTAGGQMLLTIFQQAVGLTLKLLR